MQDAGKAAQIGRRRPQLGAGVSMPDLTGTVSHIDDGTYRHLLLPVYLVTTRRGEDVQQVVVSGIDGRISALTPLSWLKVGTLTGVAVALTALYPRIADFFG
jgi:hypothetical protein